MSGFKKAEKRQGKLRIAVTGPSGSGKTYSALRLAAGIGKRIAVIDAENGSAADYADRFEFDMLELDPPYTVAKYLAALNDAYAAEYDVVVVDGISPAWAGEGGLLQQKERLDARPGSNQYTNWAPITKEHEALRGAILHNKTHLIVTMRSKQDYILEQGKNGKQVPRKVGMAPIQREGMEYEFTVCFDVGMDHQAEASKDRTSLYADGKPITLTEDEGSRLLAWRVSGVPEVEKPTQEPTAPSDAAKEAETRLLNASDDATLMKIGAEFGAFADSDKAFLRAAFKRRQKELREEAKLAKQAPKDHLPPDAEKLPEWAGGDPKEAA